MKTTSVTTLSAIALACSMLAGCGGGGDSTPPSEPPDPGPTSYTVTPSISGSGGSISPATAVAVPAGGGTSFSLSPNSGYTLSGVGGTCGGTLSGTTYTTKPVTANCTVVATFALQGTGGGSTGTGGGSSGGSVVDYSGYWVTTIAGNWDILSSVDGQGTSGTFASTYGIALGPDGSVYVADDRKVRRVAPNGMVSTVAGTDESVRCDNGKSCDGPCSSASFGGPTDVAVDASGNVYVVDYFDHSIRKISNPVTSACTVSTLAGSDKFRYRIEGSDNGGEYIPTSLTIDPSGNVYAATSDGFVIKVTPAGAVTALAGTPKLGYGYADGPGLSAQFGSLWGIALDAQGNLYVGDGDPDHTRIRKITPSGMVSTLTGGAIGYADGTGTSAAFNNILGMRTDAAGNLYVTDNGNRAIRKVTPAGVVTTIIKDGPGSYGPDGPLSRASLFSPWGIALDASGTIYFSDYSRIRKIAKP